MDNYFEILGVEQKISFDAKVLRRQFFKISLEAHPDKNLDNVDAHILFSEITKAYEILQVKDRRIGYILSLFDIITPNSKEQPSMDFLMEMMDINENLMELEGNYDNLLFNKTKDDIDSIETEISNSIISLESKLVTTFTNDDFEVLKNYYYKKRYLLRIFEKLDKFATL